MGPDSFGADRDRTRHDRASVLAAQGGTGRASRVIRGTTAQSRWSLPTGQYVALANGSGTPVAQRRAAQTPLLSCSAGGMALGGLVKEIGASSSRTVGSRPRAPATLRRRVLVGARMREEQNEAEAGA